ncbi:MAG: AI-2E family transporter [Proteobacteria bacterium]|nr:AI-2E family transporter [Pseudomonadota bacterium]
MPLIADSLRNLSAALVTAALIIAAIVLGRDILVPLSLAGVSCFVLVPAVKWLKRRCVPDGFAEGIVLFTTLALISVASFGLSSQLLSLAAELPEYRTNVLKKVRSLVGPSVPSGLVGRAIDAVESYQQMINSELQLGAGPTSQPEPESGSPPDKNKVQIVKDQSESTALYGLQILAEPLTQAALTFLFTLFLLMQYRDLRDRIVRIFGVDHMTDTTAAMSDAGDRLVALFTGQAILNASFGTFVGVILFIIGVPNAPLWGVVAFVMRFLPFVGSYIAAIPPILLAAAVDPGWTKALCTLAVFAIGEPIMGQMLEPLVLGRRAGLSPFAMVLATSFWTLAWGPMGLILAAPITIILVVLGKYIPDLEFITVLLGDEPPLSERQDLYHRFLSGDAYAALEQIEDAQKNASYANVLDRLVFPAVKLGVRDLRRGRLDKESLSEFAETVESVAQKLSSSRPAAKPSVMVIPMRGELDELATHFAVDAINRDHPDLASGITESSGLAALAFLADSRPQELHKVVLLTVTGLADSMIRILVDRARTLFSGAEVTVLDLTERRVPIANSGPDGEAPEKFTSFANFANVLEHALAGIHERVPTKLLASA